MKPPELICYNTMLAVCQNNTNNNTNNNAIRLKTMMVRIIITIMISLVASKSKNQMMTKTTDPTTVKRRNPTTMTKKRDLTTMTKKRDPTRELASDALERSQRNILNVSKENMRMVRLKYIYFYPTLYLMITSHVPHLPYRHSVSLQHLIRLKSLRQQELYYVMDLIWHELIFLCYLNHLLVHPMTLIQTTMNIVFLATIAFLLLSHLEILVWIIII